MSVRLTPQELLLTATPYNPPDWTTVGATGHAVQFYTADEQLTPLLAGYVGTALVAGDAAIVIATEAHRDALERCLESRGFSLAIARQQERFVEVDANRTLADIWTGRALDEVKIRSLVKRTIDHAKAATGRLRGRVAVFGELVALLWGMGETQAAVQLEEIWNDLMRDGGFSLCCAYPMKGFAGQADPAPFLRVCAQHSHIFPAEQKPPASQLSPLA